MTILQSRNHATPARKVPARFLAHEVCAEPYEIMGVDKSPRTERTAGGATQEVVAPMYCEFTDGGREAAGFRGDAGDCVTRAIAIALELDYRKVYDDLAERMKATGEPRSARNGIPRKVYETYLADRGWRWFPTMQIGSGCTTHLRADELPAGRLIARLSKHVCAVVDGVPHDTHDPSRDGTRCVYGFFTRAETGVDSQPPSSPQGDTSRRKEDATP